MRNDIAKVKTKKCVQVQQISFDKNFAKTNVDFRREHNMPKSDVVLLENELIVGVNSLTKHFLLRLRKH